MEHAIIVDLDITLAIPGDRDLYNATMCDRDELNVPVADIVRCYQIQHPDHQTILITGRPITYQGPTERFLAKHRVVYHQLHMRMSDDWRADDIYKREVYDTHISGKFLIHAVFEDSLAPCRMWYALGLPLFRIGDPLGLI